MSCGVGHRCNSEPAFLWMSRRMTATALIQPLTWELPYASNAALKSWKKKKKTASYKNRIRLLESVFQKEKRKTKKKDFHVIIFLLLTVWADYWSISLLDSQCKPNTNYKLLHGENANNLCNYTKLKSGFKETSVKKNVALVAILDSNETFMSP